MRGVTKENEKVTTADCKQFSFAGDTIAPWLERPFPLRYIVMWKVDASALTPSVRSSPSSSLKSASPGLRRTWSAKQWRCSLAPAEAIAQKALTVAQCKTPVMTW